MDKQYDILEKEVYDFFDEMQQNDVHAFMKMWFSAMYRNGQGTVGDMMVRVRKLRRRNNLNLFNKRPRGSNFYPEFSSRKYLKYRLAAIESYAERHYFEFDADLGFAVFEHMERNHLFENIYNSTKYQHTF